MQGCCANLQVVVFEDNPSCFGSTAHRMHVQRVADACGTGAQNTLQVGIQGVRSVEINPITAAAQAQAGQQSGQPEHVISMHVRDEHPAQLRQAQVAAQKLMLGAFPAVKQPEFRSLRQAQRDC